MNLFNLFLEACFQKMACTLLIVVGITIWPHQIHVLFVKAYHSEVCFNNISKYRSFHKTLTKSQTHVSLDLGREFETE